eukprot:TRINITY_DN1528_c0_g1_i3.p1 TRINITY_DN1528_c0_g1~~TRINITY_DN1528_c0_g1_i3.p1  ORF type:complete len:142 (-),score=23.13 TRINITY_DN1528_c0_g1_i3:40-402(-)
MEDNSGGFSSESPNIRKSPLPISTDDEPAAPVEDNTNPKEFDKSSDNVKTGSDALNPKEEDPKVGPSKSAPAKKTTSKTNGSLTTQKAPIKTVSKDVKSKATTTTTQVFIVPSCNTDQGV